LLLSESDPGAVGVAYHADASRVDKARNPSFQSGQSCQSCSLYNANPGETQGSCGLFYGKEVPQIAWCNAWEKRA
jgi:hypothetical protein